MHFQALNDIRSLGIAATEGFDLSDTNITAVCEPGCLSSLKTTRSSISDACPAEKNRLVLGTTIYPATAMIDLFISTWDKLCLKQARTN